MIRHHMIENADKYRTAAMVRRNRGFSTGKDAKGWNVKAPEPKAGTWEATRLIARQSWRLAKTEAQIEFQRQVFPERFWNELDGGAELSIDDMIAARTAAADAALLATF